MIIETILGLTGVTVFGFFLVNLLISKHHVLERLCLGYLVGQGIFTYAIFLLNFVDVPYTRLDSTLALITFIIIALLANILMKNSFSLRIKLSFNNWGIIEFLLVSVIVILFLASLSFNIYWPPRAWDSLSLYDFRAMRLLETGYTKSAIEGNSYYLSYPLFTSLAHMWIYLLGPVSPAIIYALCYIAFIIIFYFIIRRFSSRAYSLAFTLLLAMSSKIYIHSTLAYPNLYYASYLTLGYIFLFFAVLKKSTSHLILSAILIGLSTWVRTPEPFWITAIFLVIICFLYLRKILYIPLYYLIVIVFRQAWFGTLPILGSVQNNNSQPSISVSVASSTIQSLFYFFWQSLVSGLKILTNYTYGSIKTIITTQVDSSILKELFNFFLKYVISPNELLLLAFFLLTIVYGRRFFFKIFMLGTLVYGNLFVIFGGIYLTTKSFPRWQATGDSVQRVALFFIPLLIFSLAYLIRVENFDYSKLYFKFRSFISSWI